jgi:hypothetical protein
VAKTIVNAYQNLHTKAMILKHSKSFKRNTVSIIFLPMIRKKHKSLSPLVAKTMPGVGLSGAQLELTRPEKNN